MANRLMHGDDVLAEQIAPDPQGAEPDFRPEWLRCPKCGRTSTVEYQSDTPRPGVCGHDGTRMVPWEGPPDDL